VAHEVLQPDAGDRPRRHRRRPLSSRRLRSGDYGDSGLCGGVLWGSGCFSLGRSPPKPPKISHGPRGSWIGWVCEMLKNILYYLSVRALLRVRNV
jgi:hypothetical protein